PQWERRVVTEPQSGPTVFTDASSKTNMAVVVWQDKGQWLRNVYTQPNCSVQHLEALAVAQAIQLWPETHTNIVTDSMSVFKLLKNMSCPGWAGRPIAIMLESALQRRSSTIAIIHVNSHSTVKGFYQEGNDKADKAALGIWTLTRARELHAWLHLGAKALAKHCDIALSQARDVVSTCAHCQR
ncbi:POL1 protein, partial [Pandion haliaetus]|nr:POL1 protein [Pandion haliaetus]